MGDCFVRLKRSDQRAIYQLFDPLGSEVFEQIDAFFDESCRVHDQPPLRFSNLSLNVVLAYWTLALYRTSVEEKLSRYTMIKPKRISPRRLAGSRYLGTKR